MNNWYYITPEDYEEAAKNGISKTTLESRVYYLNWNIKKAVSKPVRRLKKHNLTSEDKELIVKNNLTVDIFYQRVNKLGWSKEKAINTPKDEAPLKHHRKEKKSEIFTKEQMEKAKKNGLTYTQIYQRVKLCKWSVEEAVNTPLMTNEESLKRAREKSSYKNLYK